MKNINTGLGEIKIPKKPNAETKFAEINKVFLPCKSLNVPQIGANVAQKKKKIDRMKHELLMRNYDKE